MQTKSTKIEERIQQAVKSFNIRKILFAIFCGFVVLLYLFICQDDFTIENLKKITDVDIGYLALSILMLIVRDFIYTYRIKLLAANSLSWKQCLVIIILWEFLSTITPGAVGGGAVAFLFFIKEGVPLCRAIAYVMVTSTFDTYFFSINGPFGFHYAYDILVGHGLVFAIIVYCGILCYATVMTFALFINPDLVQRVVFKIVDKTSLRKYSDTIKENVGEIVQSSRILRKRGKIFWIKILTITLLAWGSRYVILNFIIASFLPNCTFEQHIEILCKHLTMWITMIVSIVPGGAGTTEYFFLSFYEKLLGNYKPIILLVWRFLTYYIYLFIGLVVFYFWLKSFKNKYNKIDI